MKKTQVTILCLLCLVTALFSQTTGIRTTTALTAVPDAPSLISPANNSKIATNAVTLTWGTVAGAETYHIDVVMVGTPSAIGIVDSTLLVDSLYLTGLVQGLYSWRVNATNADGSSKNYNGFLFEITANGIANVTSHYIPTGMGHNGVLEVYMVNGSRVVKLAYGPAATRTQLLNTVYKSLAKGYYTYRFHDVGINSDIVGKLVK